MRPRALAGWIAFLPALVAACDGHSIDTPGAAEDRPLQVELASLYEIGGIEAEEWDAFVGISSVRFDDEGNLLVLDGRSTRVVRVDLEGEMAGEIGRRGDGPGEFPGGISIVEVGEGGTLVLGDAARGVYRRFGPDGGYLGSAPASGDHVAVGGQGRSHPSGGIVRWDLSTLDVTGGLDPDTAGIAVRIDPLDGTPPRVVTRAYVPAGGEVRVVGGRAVTGTRNIRFAPRLSVAVLPDGRIAVADSSDYRIRLYDPDGAVVGELARGLEPMALTDAWVEAERERLLQEIGPAPSPAAAGMVMFPDGSWRPAAPGEDGWRISQELRVEALEFWTELPLILDMRADAEGRLWVERRDPGSHEEVRIDAFDPEGRYLGTLSREEFRLPAAFGPGGLAAWIEQDALGVGSVRVARIVVEREAGGL